MEQEVNMLTLGNILRDMAKLDEAERCYLRFLDKTTKTPKQIANCYHSLGTVASVRTNYDRSLQWHLDSLEKKMQIFEQDNLSLATSYNYSLAIIYRKQGDYQKARDLYRKALLIWRQSFGEDHPKVAMCLNNIGAAYDDQKNHSKANEHYEMALGTGARCLPTDNRALSATHNNIGSIYYTLGDYDRALEHYTEAYRIKLRFLPNEHSSIVIALRNTGMAHEKKVKRWKQLNFTSKHLT